MTKPCSSCHQHHDPPRGKKCQHKKNNDNSVDSAETALLSMTQTILDQLGNMDARIAALEQSAQAEASKTDAATAMSPEVDTVDLTTSKLRADLSIQQQVSARLKDLGLATDTDDSDLETKGASASAGKTIKSKRSKLKSGREKTVSDYAKLFVEWPHFHVFRGTERKPAKFDELSLQEFMFGCLNIILDGVDESDFVQQRAMLALLRDICSDAMEFSWENARNCYAIILQQMEQGRLTWSDTESLQQLRRTYAHKSAPASSHAFSKSSNSVSPAKGTCTSGPLYCYKFQEGTCSFSADHSTTRGSVRHICAYCLKAVGAAYNHGEHECQRKVKHPKNDKVEA